jgi:hypothetical protein
MDLLINQKGHDWQAKNHRQCLYVSGGQTAIKLVFETIHQTTFPPIDMPED